MCNGNNDQDCEIQVFREDVNGYRTLPSSVCFNLKEMRNLSHGNSLRLKCNNGEVIIKNAFCHSNASFLDYVFGGLEIGIQVVIDFTLSNGCF